jgi:hypothetical protein
MTERNGGLPKQPEESDTPEDSIRSAVIEIIKGEIKAHRAGASDPIAQVDLSVLESELFMRGYIGPNQTPEEAFPGVIEEATQQLKEEDS